MNDIALNRLLINQALAARHYDGYVHICGSRKFVKILFEAAIGAIHS